MERGLSGRRKFNRIPTPSPPADLERKHPPGGSERCRLVSRDPPRSCRCSIESPFCLPSTSTMPSSHLLLLSTNVTRKLEMTIFLERKMYKGKRNAMTTKVKESVLGKVDERKGDRKESAGGDAFVDPSTLPACHLLSSVVFFYSYLTCFTSLILSLPQLSQCHRISLFVLIDVCTWVVVLSISSCLLSSTGERKLSHDVHEQWHLSVVLRGENDDAPSSPFSVFACFVVFPSMSTCRNTLGDMRNRRSENETEDFSHFTSFSFSTFSIANFLHQFQCLSFVSQPKLTSSISSLVHL